MENGTEGGLGEDGRQGEGGQGKRGRAHTLALILRAMLPLYCGPLEEGKGVGAVTMGK